MYIFIHAARALTEMIGLKNCLCEGSRQTIIIYPWDYNKRKFSSKMSSMSSMFVPGSAVGTLEMDSRNWTELKLGLPNYL